MVRLVPMTKKDYAAFIERIIPEYAEENVKAGYWAESEALEKSRNETEKLLPDGVATENHYLFTIEAESGERVGMIWLRADLASPVPSGFIFDLHIADEFRRKGYARQAMLELEEQARQLGLKKLGLHVFAHNYGARALYAGLDYQLSSLNMIKELTPSHD